MNILNYLKIDSNTKTFFALKYKKRELKFYLNLLFKIYKFLVGLNILGYNLLYMENIKKIEERNLKEEKKNYLDITFIYRCQPQFLRYNKKNFKNRSIT